MREQKEGRREYSPKAVLQLWTTAHSSRQCVNRIIKPWELLRDSKIGGTVLWMQISDTLNITKGTAVPLYKSLLLFSLGHCVQLWSLSRENISRAREENIQRRAVRLVSMKIFGLCISVRKEIHKIMTDTEKRYWVTPSNSCKMSETDDCWRASLWKQGQVVLKDVTSLSPFPCPFLPPLSGDQTTCLHSSPGWTANRSGDRNVVWVCAGPQPNNGKWYGGWISHDVLFQLLRMQPVFLANIKSLNWLVLKTETDLRTSTSFY